MPGKETLLSNYGAEQRRAAQTQAKGINMAVLGGGGVLLPRRKGL